MLRTAAGNGSTAAQPPSSVALVSWPAEAARREVLAAQERARLLVIAEGVAPPPLLDCLEDWIHAPAPEDEVRARMEALEVRARCHHPVVPELDGEGFLHFGSRWVHLPPVEARLAGVMVERFERVVGATTLVRAGWPQGTSSRGTLDVRIHRLRRRLSPLGLVIRTVRQRGWMLEAAGPDDIAPKLV